MCDEFIIYLWAKVSYGVNMNWKNIREHAILCSSQHFFKGSTAVQPIWTGLRCMQASPDWLDWPVWSDWDGRPIQPIWPPYYEYTPPGEAQGAPKVRCASGCAALSFSLWWWCNVFRFQILFCQSWFCESSFCIRQREHLSLVKKHYFCWGKAIGNLFLLCTLLNPILKHYGFIA